MTNNNPPQNYKNSEIGIIPQDWEVKRFGDIIDYIKGFPFKSKDYQQDGIRIIRVSDTTFDSIKKTNGIFIDEKDEGIYKKWRLEESDLIFTTVGSKPPMYDSMVGKVIKVSKEFEGSLLNQNAVLIRAKHKTIQTQTLLLNNFQTKRYLQYIELIYRGNANQASITLKELFNFQIPLPPTLREQTAIANALSDADALISSLEKLIEKKRNIKQGAMQKLLQPKEGWEVKKLGECLLKNPDYGINAAAVEFDDTLPTYLRITDISEDGRYLSSNKVSVNNILATSFYLEEGDIVFARTGASVGKTYLYDKNDGMLVFAGFLIRIKANTEILSPKYLFFLTQTKSYWDWVLANSMRSGQPGLNSNEYKSWQISIPPLSEQTHIATILSDMDAEIEGLEAKLEKYRAIKLGMMQELLTGKTRLV